MLTWRTSLERYLELWQGHFEVQLDVLDLLGRQSVTLADPVLINSWIQVQSQKNLTYIHWKHRGRQDPELVIQIALKSTQGLEGLQGL
jgi:hypothetical protein